MTKKIGLDIGHGENTFPYSKGVFKDGKGFAEHHFNADVALIAENRLREHGFEVVMAQPAYKNDVILATRTNKYNAENVDLVVSVHANASSNASANGAGVFHWHTSTAGKKLAQLFMKNFVDAKTGVGVWGANNGVWASQPNHWTNFHMVRVPKAPAVLLELGFMTNLTGDFEYIFGSKSKKFREQCSEVIVKTVCEYFGVKYKAPDEKTEAPKHSTPVQHNEGNYKIEQGDTFYSISVKYGVSVQDLQNANPTVNHRNLQVGSYIVVPVKKEVKEAPKGNMTTTSVVVYLNSIGVDSSFANRARLAQQHGIVNYAGTADQNTRLLASLRNVGVQTVAPVTKAPAPKYSLPTGSLRRGNKGENVKLLQTALNALRFNVGAVDGDFGAKTEDAVRRFQLVHDAYNVDGIYGARTRERMNNLLNK